MKTFLFLLLCPLAVFSQKEGFVKNDTLLLSNNKCPSTFIRLSSSSWSNYAMVLVTDIKNFNQIKKRIPQIYASRKQEYSDFHLIGIKNLISNKHKNEIVTLFLNKIDSTRMTEGLSVFLKYYNMDQSTGKITYLKNLKSLKEVSNLYYLFSEQDICKYMLCRR